MKELDVAVVIPTRNRPQLAWDLALYLRQDLRWEGQIIISDQSDDGGVALLKLSAGQPLSGVSVRVCPGLGTSRGRNFGAMEATASWLVFLDDDVMPLPSFFEALADFVHEHPWVDAIQGGIGKRDAWEQYRKDPENWIQQWREEAAPSRQALPEAYDGIQWLTASVRANYPAPTIGVGSGNLAIRRRVFMAVGGFDENMPGRGEDREIGLRLWWYGYNVYYAPRVYAFHARHEEGGTRRRAVVSLVDRLQLVEPEVGWVYFYMKWFPGLPLRQMIWHHIWSKSKRRPWVFIVSLIRARRSLREARRLLDRGPHYVSLHAPITREELFRTEHVEPGVREEECG